MGMSSKKHQIPAIRFEGFTDAWEQRKLGDVYTERNKRGNDSLKILSVSIHHGVSNEELDSNSLGKEVRRSEDKSLYKHVYFGDLVLNMMRAWQGAVGVVKSEAMVSPAYITAVPSAELYPLFMDFYLRRDEAIGQMNNLSYGVTDFRKRLYWDSFVKVLCHIPTVAEQEKITVFFTHLDDTIALHQRKLTLLKQLKEAYLQLMFPQIGENSPALRFAGFSEPWEQRKLNDLYEKGGSGGTPQSTNKSYYKGDIPFLGISDISASNGYIYDTEKHISEKGLNNSSAWIVPKEAISLAMYASVGKVAILKTEAATSQAFYNMVFKKISTRNFIFQYLLKIESTNGWNRLISTGTQANLNAQKVRDLEIMIPSLEEQDKIGTFFNRIDHTIDLHQKKISHIQDLKKALLQKMFI